MKALIWATFALALAVTSPVLAKPDLRPPREVLPGHWQEGSGKLHYYIEKDRITMIDGGKLLGTYPFEIVEENFPENWIKIKLQADDGNLRMIRVDFKRRGFMETFQVRGVTLNNIMLYVDDKPAPAP